MFNSDGGITMPVAPIYGNGGAFGGSGIEALIWIVVIVALFGGGFGNGFFGGGWGNNAATQGALTRGELCQDMDFQDVKNSVRGIQQSVTDGFALQNVNFTDRLDNLSTQVATGFDAVNLAIVNDGYQTRQAAQQNMIANMQNTYAIQNTIQAGFCDMKSGFAQIAYNQASDTCAIQNSIANAARDITENANNNTRMLYDFMVNEKMSSLEAENQNLRLQASQQAQNSYLISELRPCAKPAYITCSPYTSSYGVGMSNCCGCGA